MSEASLPPKTILRCPRCRAETAWQDNPFRPFCSEKCRIIDLGRWANEDYRVPGAPVAPEEAGKVLPFPEQD